jgi:hypothetical protein
VTIGLGDAAGEELAAVGVAEGLGSVEPLELEHAVNVRTATTPAAAIADAARRAMGQPPGRRRGVVDRPRETPRHPSMVGRSWAVRARRPRVRAAGRAIARHDAVVPADLEPVSRARIPVPEVSGLCALDGEGPVTLVALGDDRVSIAIASVDDAGLLGGWHVVTADDVGATRQERFTQLESVALDGAGRAWVLTEGTSLLAGVDLDTRSPAGVLALDTSTIPELHATWTPADASRGEGLVLLVDGHVLVAKEKDPAGLVELGPAGDAPLGITADSLLPARDAFEAVGDRLVALAWWPWVDDELDDLSDLAVDRSGALWVLSDQSRALARIALPLAPDAPPQLVEVLRLPKKIAKPEGLAFLPSQLIAVADDRHDDADNLWLLRRR